MAFAINEAQLERWTRREPRLKASVIVPYEDADASRQEIQRRAGDRSFAQVMMLSRTAEALGRALLADLRGRRRGRAAGRHPCLRLQRLGDDQYRLAVVLHRGGFRARHVGAGGGDRAWFWKACSSAIPTSRWC